MRITGKAACHPVTFKSFTSHSLWGRAQNRKTSGTQRFPRVQLKAVGKRSANFKGSQSNSIVILQGQKPDTRQPGDDMGTEKL
jgi:hypothetical protein